MKVFQILVSNKYITQRDELMNAIQCNNQIDSWYNNSVCVCVCMCVCMCLYVYVCVLCEYLCVYAQAVEPGGPLPHKIYKCS